MLAHPGLAQILEHDPVDAPGATRHGPDKAATPGDGVEPRKIDAGRTELLLDLCAAEFDLVEDGTCAIPGHFRIGVRNGACEIAVVA